MDDGPMLEITAVEIAHHLARCGEPLKGAVMLRDLIVQHPRSVTIKGVTALARLAYDGKSWADAASLWRLVVNAKPNHLEGLLKLSHCLIELGQKPEVEKYIAQISTVLGTEKNHEDAVANDALLAGAYEQLCVHFLQNESSTVEDLLRLCTLPRSYASSVVKAALPEGPAAGLHDEAILARLEAAFRDWERTGCSVPYLEEQQRRNRLAANKAKPEAKRVLLVFRKYFLGSADSREHELALFMQASAKAVGFETLFFAAEPFLNPKTFEPARQYSELDKLARLVISAKPDLVVFDDLCNQEALGERIDREVYRNLFCALKASQPFKLIAFYPDAWTPASLSTIEYVSAFADVIWHQNLDLVKDHPEPRQAAMYCAPIAYPEEFFRLRESGKQMNAAFLGGLFDYNCPRGIWLSLIKSRRLPCQIFLSNHKVTGSPAGTTVEEYGAFMSRLKMSVNFSARTAAKKIMTGRAWESIIAQCLLLEEENDEIKRFFVPFVHYVPFRNIDELQAYLSFFQRNENLRRQIAESAFRWFQQVFSKERIWSDLILATVR